MKVISGKFKGRLIEINSKNNFRPTLSRIREDLFNLLEHNSKLNVELESAIFCDCRSFRGAELHQQSHLSSF